MANLEKLVEKMANMEAEVGKMDDRLQEMAKFEGKMANLEMEIGKMEKELQMARLGGQMGNMEAEMATLKAKADNLGGKMANLEMEMATEEEIGKMAKWEAKTEKWEVKSVTNLETEVAKSEAKMAYSETEVAQSEAKMANLETEVAKSEAKMAYSETEVAKSEAKMANLETEVAKSEAKMANLETEVAKSEAKMAYSETEVAQSEAKMANLETEVAKSEAKMAYSETEVAKSEAKMAYSETEVAKSEAKMANLETEVAKSETKMAYSETEVAKLEAKMANSETEILKNPSSAIEQLIKGRLINPIEDNSQRYTLYAADFARTNKSGCFPQLIADSAVCSQALCYHLSYRSIDGVCNNLARPTLGASFRAYMRYLPADYSDGFSEPAGSGRRPTAREASRFVLAKSTPFIHDQINSMFMQLGQFMAQDMTKAAHQPVDPCSSCAPLVGKCMPVPISEQDNNPIFRQTGCLKVSRSASVCGTGDQQQGKPREQLNENTAFVDGSTIYGSNAKDLLKVRDGRTGFLKMSSFNGMMLLPFDASSCGAATNRGTCAAATFVTGDTRVNTFIGLSSLYTIFVREHNRIARELQSLNRAWSGDRLFQETRKIVGAEIQAVLYNEFIPLMLGPSAERLIGPYNGYDQNVDPTVANEFTAAAFRFGHGTIVEQYSRLMENSQSIAAGPFPLNEGTFKSQKLLSEGGIDPVLRGLWNTPIKRPQQMTAAVTDYLFSTTDLGTLNIARGRDHGLPSYNKMRRACGLNAFSTFDQLADLIRDPAIRGALSSLYESPDDIDLYVGGLVEEPLIGALVGPTFACIIGDQFKRTRDGDRFYYESPGIFSSAQLAELKKTSMARLLCDNGDHISKVPFDALLLPSAIGTVPCARLAQLDLRKWSD
ncbi:hypothetical protein niasHS_013780 [Heterodera schachtii]|uniref:peroxidase n=1 Tax=Heterodera schachtii TaxID=97005 RepID=A0ABD2IV79_HETSC